MEGNLFNCHHLTLPQLLLHIVSHIDAEDSVPSGVNFQEPWRQEMLCEGGGGEFPFQELSSAHN